METQMGCPADCWGIGVYHRNIYQSSSCDGALYLPQMGRECVPSRLDYRLQGKSYSNRCRVRYTDSRTLRNISAATYKFWQGHPLVELATPISLGDNVQGHPLVGTDSSYYPWFGLALKEGHLPAATGEVVLDAALANQLQVGIGARLTSAHMAAIRGANRMNIH